MSVISIPYGAIKSLKESTGLSLMLSISIPYGAIKRLSWGQSSLTLYKFQFLMVRLKVSNCPLSANTLSISIPYGAIKSLDEVDTSHDSYLFQFLMVRLKEHHFFIQG